MSNFSALSRYASLPQAQFTLPDGRVVSYVRRRFLPDPARFSLLQEHEVRQGDRLDNVTAFYLGDPEQFWRIADANGAIQPERLLDVPGDKLRITLPEGLPGVAGEFGGGGFGAGGSGA
jgi:hypothetical protein